MTPPQALSIESPSAYCIKEIKFENPTFGRESPPRCYVVDVRIGVDDFQKPQFKPLFKALQELGKLLGPDTVVVFQQSLYPGFISEVCLPLLESSSKKKANVDFYYAFAPKSLNESSASILYVSSPVMADYVTSHGIKEGQPACSFATLPEAEAAYVKQVCEEFVLRQWRRESKKFFDSMGLDTHRFCADQPIARDIPVEVLHTYKTSKKQGKYLRMLAGSLEV